MGKEVKKPSQETESVLTQKDLNKCYRRLSLWGETSLNFERMQSVGWCNAMAPALEKIYTKKEDLAEALQRHLQFFNTELMFGNLIFGPAIALEEEKAQNPDKVSGELITSFKTGTMGPVAAIGDSIHWATAWTLAIAFAGALAAKGAVSSIAVLLGLVVGCEIVAYALFRLGYTTGRMSFAQIMKSGLLNELLDGANILGMFMMGALSSSLVVLIPALKIGKFVLKDTLDGILPGMLPLIIVFGVYYLIRKKNVSTAKIVILLIAIGILGSLIGLF
ncbi:PTS system mannose/fructose/sorbose family transporter subunit IID [Anaerostipes sp.]|uniref:PTS system mannose/fructose/sorbose family transporter subunit IID n=1 Tax=Anaerostipes sp. TaxID=1872530 RepID=UPI0025847744|nr:PTS system mannose/fructose/sorbose family transporter subunit IID [Anaerostipes sp.]MCI5623317.1 PTS system mannose/fructose/sorbose family transporter subunit IID [Anaerostipes sp.]